MKKQNKLLQSSSIIIFLFSSLELNVVTGHEVIFN
jgi:hypothetical protein